MKIIRRLLADDRGATAIEYSLLVSFIALGLVTSVGDVGANVAESLDDVHSGLTDSAGAPTPAGAGGPGNGNGKGNGKGKGKPPKKP